MLKPSAFSEFPRKPPTAEMNPSSNLQDPLFRRVLVVPDGSRVRNGAETWDGHSARHCEGPWARGVGPCAWSRGVWRSKAAPRPGSTLGTAEGQLGRGVNKPGKRITTKLKFNQPVRFHITAKVPAKERTGTETLPFRNTRVFVFFCKFLFRRQ